MDIKYTEFVNEAFVMARSYAIEMRHEFVTPEHLLKAFLEQIPFQDALQDCFCDDSEIRNSLDDCLRTQFETCPGHGELEPTPSVQLNKVIQYGCLLVRYSNGEMLDVPHLVQGILQLEDSWACQLLHGFLNEGLGDDNISEFISALVSAYEDNGITNSTNSDSHAEAWRNYVVCLNDMLASHNPLIGREEELERTVQVLCRKDKNNPLHVGEPGVGKTALAYGLAARIESGDVPERLLGSCIYELDLGGLIAGTQYRGDFEKRLKTILDGIRKEGNAIVYIDEIHNIVGAGRTGDGSMDASNMLKPYLESGDIRFMGSTTYEEYNRFFAQSRGMVRRFQQIDIAEPLEDEAVRILEGLKEKYESFHHVVYEPEAIRYAVHGSAQFVNDRFLPDKAIDLIDEAGAYREIHPLPDGSRTVGKELIVEVLSRICKVDAMAMHEEDTKTLESLEPRILSKIYGQDEAVRQVVEAVQMAKAGLIDDNKPLASLLFVGPTGVGKTEVARVLAAELGIALQRFDMSEYAEKHTVAKLIGSPAGYVGYDDGGLLTDTLRKTPNCVLLLDEIEKAHPDIFNILLQVMDYAVLTDNKGRKSDCRHVILIMTSNAGAQYAHQASIGFGSHVSAGDAMLRQVKKTFKPEFINRLSSTVVFHDMDRDMAVRILDKKLAELGTRLDARQVTMRVSDEAHDWLLQKGFTPEYGAREIDRVISSFVKPLLTREILFGSLVHGGSVELGLDGDRLVLRNS